MKGLSQQLRQTWNALQPAFHQQHHSEHIQSYYDKLISLLELAQTPGEYALLTAPLLAEINQLREVLSL